MATFGIIVIALVTVILAFLLIGVLLCCGDGTKADEPAPEIAAPAQVPPPVPDKGEKNDNGDVGFEEAVRKIEEKFGVEGYYAAQMIRNAHNRAMQGMRERIDRLEDQLHENGLEVE